MKTASSFASSTRSSAPSVTCGFCALTFTGRARAKTSRPSLESSRGKQCKHSCPRAIAPRMKAKVVSLSAVIVSAGSMMKRMRTVQQSHTSRAARQLSGRDFAKLGSMLPRSPCLIPLGAGLCATALVLLAPGGHAASKPARVAVASENAVSTREGLAELAAGGNAIDAIVRAALVAGIASPSSSGLGGGGFAMIWRAATREPYVLDFRETAPAALDAPAFEARPFPPEERARATGVPGELAGLWQLQHELGKRNWRDVVLPAARVAETGFAVSQHLSNALASPWSKLAQTDAGL